MNDELDRILSSPAPGRPSISSPCLQIGPRVQGGQPLEGGPRLEIELCPDSQIRAKDEAQGMAGPHPGVQAPEHDPPSAAGEAEKPKLRPAKPASPLVGLAGSSQVEAAGLKLKPAEAPMASRPDPKTDPLVAVVHLKKSYHKGNIEVPVLRDVSLGVRQGEFLAVVGQSGSGKSTLLHLLGTLDAPDAGEIYFDRRRIDDLAGSCRDALRNRRFGMIFQFYHLLPELTTLENVLAPLMIGQSVWSYFLHRRKHKAAATELLGLVGLEHRLKHRPSELSGGEMQRAAIARALIARPELLLADEPTGNLDRDTGREIMKILRTLNQRQNLTIVMVTHDQAIAGQADRIVRLVDGRIEEASVA